MPEDVLKFWGPGRLFVQVSTPFEGPVHCAKAAVGAPNSAPAQRAAASTSEDAALPTHSAGRQRFASSAIAARTQSTRVKLARDSA
jgi:hypothetical protein